MDDDLRHEFKRLHDRHDTQDQRLDILTTAVQGNPANPKEQAGLNSRVQTLEDSDSDRDEKERSQRRNFWGLATVALSAAAASIWQAIKSALSHH